MPVARKVWQPIFTDIPASAARRRIIRQTSIHREACKDASLADRRPEQGRAALVADPGRGEVLVEVRLELVVRRHLVPLAALLMESEPPAFAFGIVIVDRHAQP